MTGGNGEVLVSHDGGATWEPLSKDVIAAAGIAANKS
jgi:photosystem II stability/assembly factor-like uncharacterized protein